ncbi:hypothetical protein TrRE_jg11745, partial [Triparma retinervis]
ELDHCNSDKKEAKSSTTATATRRRPR